MDSDRCLLCNDVIREHDTPRLLRCTFCGAEKPAMRTCAHNHFACESCLSASPVSIIRTVCGSTDSSDPFMLMELITRHPSINNSRPEYSTLVTAVLITAYYNAIQRKEELWHQLNEAINRSGEIPVGLCGLNGISSAEIGAGIFMSLIFHSTPLSLKGWKHRNRLMAGALELIAEEGDPRCCKRNAYLIITHVIDVMRKEFNIPMDRSENISCIHVEPNPECIKSKCRFYKTLTEESIPDRISTGRRI